MAVVGEPFDEFVYKQINKRQKIHGKTERTIEDLQYLNSKTAWVKLASGVKLVGDERIKNLEFKGIGQDTDLARKYVLFGGTAFKSKTSTTLKQLEGFKTNQVWGNTYNVNAKQQTTNLDFGFVPPPGIESVEVKNMNRGSIKKATVKIKAYSRDQFDILDILYMRLGYTVLLEWGWSHYFSNSGKLETMGYTLVEAENGFFSDTAKSHRQFLRKIGAYREGKSGNYDGLLAKVSNFDWSFNPDGSYDINLTLISLGDVIESLKTNVSPRLIDGEIVEEDKPKDVLSEYLYIWKKINSNILEKETRPTTSISFNTGAFLNIIGYIIDADKYTSNIETTIGTIAGEEEAKRRGDKLREELKSKGNIIIREFSTNTTAGDNPTKYYYNIEHKLDINITPGLSDVIYFEYSSPTEENTKTSIGSNNINYYMRFSHLLEMVKKLCLPVNRNNELIIDIKFQSTDASPMKMLYYPNQISFDPRICVVRGEIDGNKIFPQLKEWGNENDGSARIENIYVNFSTIQNAIDNNLDENNKLALVSFFQSICNDLNRALGGINNLEPVVDEDDNLLRIIDGSYLSDDINRRDYFLEVFGYNPDPKFNSSNFVRNIDLKTQITPEYAAMVTIGATAGGYVKGTEATMFSKWNKGIVDRFKEEYNPPSSENLPAEEIQNIKDEPKDNYIKYLNSLEKILGFDGNGNGKNTLDDAIIDNNLSVVEEYYKYLNALAQEKDPGFSSTTNGFIPFNLGVTMDGISGMKIYNKLNVSNSFFTPKLS
jgi:hypothetical protein